MPPSIWYDKNTKPPHFDSCMNREIVEFGTSCHAHYYVTNSKALDNVSIGQGHNWFYICHEGGWGRQDGKEVTFRTQHSLIEAFPQHFTAVVDGMHIQSNITASNDTRPRDLLLERLEEMGYKIDIARH